MKTPMRFSAALLGLLVFGNAVHAVDPAFSDHTDESGIDVFFTAGGYSHPGYTGGGAVGDFNRDGLQDIFVLDGSGRDYLYINNGDGTFTDRALDWGLLLAHKGKGASVGDVNGDGWLDIFVTSAGPLGSATPCEHKLYLNNGNGTFTENAAAAGVACTTTSTEDGFGSTFGDYDLDGDLDLFVAGFASNNAGSRLFQNDGSGSFTDVTAAAQIFNQTPGMSAFNPRLVDMDGDDYPDLPLGADFGTSRYFRNERDGTFTDITASSNTGQEENGMGGAIGDFDNDGLLDWYVTSILLTGVGWTGNKLYMNQGNHDYVEVAESAGVDEGGYGWAALAVDFNHDGLVDILETNGDNNAAGPFFGEQSYLWINDGDTYTEMALDVGLVHEGRGRGMAHLDFDNDGDQDVIIFGNVEQVRFYRNDLSGPGTNWLRVFLNTDSAAGLAPGGTGARVQVTSGFTTKLRYVASGDNFLSHSELSAHFGLGFADEIDQLRVHWPGGNDAVLEHVDVNQTITLVAHDNPPLCSPAPAEVSGLLLGRTGTKLDFTWTDVAGADDYLVLADSGARGDFNLQVGSAVSGSGGLQAPMPSASRYFVVAGRDGTCIGP